MQKINKLEDLESVYPRPASERSRWKEVDDIDEVYRRFIEISPFLIIASRGEKGIDCSPRGDGPGFVRVASPRQILIPDRKGNNRLDTLRNILSCPEVGLIFLVPNVGETIRVSGRAEILVDPELNASFAVNGKAASSVISVSVDKAYFQCQKALARSRLWDPASYPERERLPSAGDMTRRFGELHGVDFDGAAYDAEYPEYMKQNLY